MKFLNDEIINVESIEDNVIFVNGGNKKFHLAFQLNGKTFGLNEKKNMVIQNPVPLLITKFKQHQQKEAMAVYSKKWFQEFKESLVEKRAKYTAAILTEESGLKLYKTLEHMIPENWMINCHHMTICLGEPIDEVKHLLGQEVEINVVGYRYSEEYQLISVLVESDVYSKNEKKHITVALNKEEGAQASHSNKIDSYHHMPETLTLKATVDTVLNNSETRLGVSEFKIK